MKNSIHKQNTKTKKPMNLLHSDSLPKITAVPFGIVHESLALGRIQGAGSIYCLLSNKAHKMQYRMRETLDCDDSETIQSVRRMRCTDTGRYSFCSRAAHFPSVALNGLSKGCHKIVANLARICARNGLIPNGVVF